MPICEICKKTKDKEIFLEDSDHANICTVCLTDDELKDYVRPTISKLMEGLTPDEKKSILIRIMEHHKIMKKHQRMLKRKPSKKSGCDVMKNFLKNNLCPACGK
jgi:hypothetical protein